MQSKFLFHPGLVESGVTGFPELQPGHFYTVEYSSYDSRNNYALGGVVWECASAPTTHSDLYISYLMLNISPHKGIILERCLYGWFGKGRNIVLELPEHQQEALRALKKAVKDDRYIHLPSDEQLQEYRVQQKSR